MNKNTPLNTPYPIVDNPPKVVEINKEFLNPKEFNILDAKIFEKNLTNLLIDKINPIQNTGSIFRNLLNPNISKLLGRITYNIESPIIIKANGTIVKVICFGIEGKLNCLNIRFS